MSTTIELASENLRRRGRARSVNKSKASVRGSIKNAVRDNATRVMHSAQTTHISRNLCVFVLHQIVSARFKFQEETHIFEVFFYICNRETEASTRNI